MFDVEKFNCNNEESGDEGSPGAAGVNDQMQLNEDQKDSLNEDQKQEIMDKSHSSIILGLGYKPHREGSRERNEQAVWLKLEQLYMTKSLANTLSLKQRLYSFKMQEDMSIFEQIDQFNKIIYR